MSHSPFCLENTEHYLQWRNHKLSGYPCDPNDLFTEIADPTLVNTDEIRQIIRTVKHYNLAFYRFLKNDHCQERKHVHKLGKRLGLRNLDNNLCADSDKLTSIKVQQTTSQNGYIPYTNRQLSWHTDGYYNTPDRQIKGMLLHCAQPAINGGENMLLNTEIAYILLRDENPEYITALMQADAMTIPENIQNGKLIRPAQTGPVFSVSKEGHLHMRYSARKRNIQWKEDRALQEAVRFLEEIWDNGSPYILKYKLKAGEGVVCNNVLHNRTAFQDSEEKAKMRLLYRGRYYDRVAPPANK